MFAASIVLTGWILVTGGPASAATRIVDNDKVQCPTAGYTSIMSAVDAAAPNDVVQVCAGVYRERVVIRESGIKLRGKGRATIKPVGAAEMVSISGTSVRNVEVSGFRLTGPWRPAPECGSFDEFPRTAAVFLGYGATGIQILKNRMTRLRAVGCPDFGTAGIITDANGDAVRAVIRDNVFDDYRTGGILSEGSVLSVINNTFSAATLDPRPDDQPSGQIGVFFGSSAETFGTFGTISGNVISDNLGASQSARDGYGIVVDSPAGLVSITGNEVSENDTGVLLGGVHIPAKVRVNQIHDNLFEGLDLLNSSGVLLDKNDVRGNSGLDCRDNSVTSNGSFGAPYYGTRNQWTQNLGFTATPLPLCNPALTTLTIARAQELMREPFGIVGPNYAGYGFHFVGCKTLSSSKVRCIVVPSGTYGGSGGVLDVFEVIASINKGVVIITSKIVYEGCWKFDCDDIARGYL